MYTNRGLNLNVLDSARFVFTAEIEMNKIISSIESIESIELLHDYWSAPKKDLSDAEQTARTEEIRELLIAEDAVLVAHYYTGPSIQALAERTGDCAAGSIGMARFGRDHKASPLEVAGVRVTG